MKGAKIFLLSFVLISTVLIFTIEPGSDVANGIATSLLLGVMISAIIAGIFVAFFKYPYSQKEIEKIKASMLHIMQHRHKEGFAGQYEALKCIVDSHPDLKLTEWEVYQAWYRNFIDFVVDRGYSKYISSLGREYDKADDSAYNPEAPDWQQYDLQESDEDFYYVLKDNKNREGRLTWSQFYLLCAAGMIAIGSVILMTVSELAVVEALMLSVLISLAGSAVVTLVLDLSYGFNHTYTQKEIDQIKKKVLDRMYANIDLRRGLKELNDIFAGALTLKIHQWPEFQSWYKYCADSDKWQYAYYHNGRKYCGKDDPNYNPAAFDWIEYKQKHNKRLSDIDYLDDTDDCGYPKPLTRDDIEEIVEDALEDYGENHKGRSISTGLGIGIGIGIGNSLTDGGHRGDHSGS